MSNRSLGVMGALLAAALVAVVGLTPGVASAVADGSDVPDGKYRFAAALSMPLITRPDGSTYSSACSGALGRVDAGAFASAAVRSHRGAA